MTKSVLLCVENYSMNHAVGPNLSTYLWTRQPALIFPTS